MSFEFSEKVSTRSDVEGSAEEEVRRATNEDSSDRMPRESETNRPFSIGSYHDERQRKMVL